MSQCTAIAASNSNSIAIGISAKVIVSQQSFWLATVTPNSKKVANCSTLRSLCFVFYPISTYFPQGSTVGIRIYAPLCCDCVVYKIQIQNQNILTIFLWSNASQPSWTCLQACLPLQTPPWNNNATQLAHFVDGTDLIRNNLSQLTRLWTFRPP